MLTCIRKAFELAEKHYGENFRLPLPGELKPGEVHGYDLATVPDKVEAVYDMLCRADSIGVFQVESRAQMSMLPRLRAAGVLRPRHRGRDRAAGADPGRHGASLFAAAREAPDDGEEPPILLHPLNMATTMN